MIKLNFVLCFIILRKFSTLDSVFSKDLFSYYLELTTAVDIVLLFSHFLVLWDCRIIQLFVNRVALNPGLGGVRDVAYAIISHKQTQ